MGIRETKGKKKKNPQGDAKGGTSMGQKSEILLSKEIKEFS